MPMYFPYISALLGLTPLLVIARSLLLLCLPSIRRRTTLSHECGVIAFWLYLAAVCCCTVNLARVLQGHFEMGRNYNLVPFAEIIGIAANAHTAYALLNIVGNVVMFAPLGFLLPLLWRHWQGTRVFLVSMLLSGGIEVLQLFTGRSADIDDVMLNTLGGICGYLGFRIAHRLLPSLTKRFRLLNHAAPGPAAERHSACRQTEKTPSDGGARASHLQKVKHRQREQERGYRRTALVITGAALCVLVTGTVLLSGLVQSSALAGSPGRFSKDRSLQIPALNSTNVLLVAQGQTLYEKNADQRIYPASMTKIMTAVLVLEQLEDLGQPVYLREEIFSEIHSENLATAGFLPGEEAAAIDLLYGLMLPSGAECAVGLAEYVSGSERDFAAHMNEKAWELGMSGTHFSNATGRHERDHYTTAADIALLMGYALDNPTFRLIASSERHSTAPTNLHPDGITFYSTLLGRGEEAAYPAGLLLGGKTGYTDKAGQCLASFGQAGGEELILVTAGAWPEDFRTQQLHIEDALAVYFALN